MADTKDRGRRFLVVGFSTVHGVPTGGEVWEDELVADLVNVQALIEGGHIREMEPESRPTSRRAPAKSAGEGDD